MSSKQDFKLVQLGKTLSYVLRHGAVKEKLEISSDGYVRVNDLLKHKLFVGKYTLEQIKTVVETNSKQRFNLKQNSVGDFVIRANQGHSLKETQNLALTPVTITNINVIHGTYYDNWKYIKTSGLSRMKRNHIHFAKALPGKDKTVISGMRPDCDVFIYINLTLALTEDCKFFESSNGVILCPGNKHGLLETKYFLKVEDKSGKNLAF